MYSLTPSVFQVNDLLSDVDAHMSSPPPDSPANQDQSPATGTGAASSAANNSPEKPRDAEVVSSGLIANTNAAKDADTTNVENADVANAVKDVDTANPKDPDVNPIAAKVVDTANPKDAKEPNAAVAKDPDPDGALAIGISRAGSKPAKPTVNTLFLRSLETCCTAR